MTLAGSKMFGCTLRRDADHKLGVRDEKDMALCRARLDRLLGGIVHFLSQTTKPSLPAIAFIGGLSEIVVSATTIVLVSHAARSH
jgi:hypothetical protein